MCISASRWLFFLMSNLRLKADRIIAPTRHLSTHCWTKVFQQYGLSTACRRNNHPNTQVPLRPGCVCTGYTAAVHGAEIAKGRSRLCRGSCRYPGRRRFLGGTVRGRWEAFQGFTWSSAAHQERKAADRLVALEARIASCRRFWLVEIDGCSIHHYSCVHRTVFCMWHAVLPLAARRRQVDD